MQIGKQYNYSGGRQFAARGWRGWLRLVALGCLLVSCAGCFTPGGVRTDSEKYAGNQHNVSTLAEKESKSNYNIPYLDPNFTLAPSDVLGLSFYTRSEPLAEYPLQIGDTVFIEFHQQEHLNRNGVIQPDGRMPMPYIGAVPAAGKSAQKVAEEVTAEYKAKELFKNVQVSVSVLAFNSRLKELQATISNGITGQIRDVPVGQDGYMSLPMADRVLVAGKMLEEVRKNIRAAYETAIPGASVDVELRSVGSSNLYVLGEVKNPGLVSINKPMSVLQAITAAGGYTTGADLTSVAVLRADDTGCPTGRLVDVRKILNEGNLSEDIMMRRFDIVYVPPHRIKKLNDGIVMYIRNMMPLETTQSLQYGYVWGNDNHFSPFW